MVAGLGPRLTIWTLETHGASVWDTTPCDGVKGFLDESLMVAVTEPRVALIPTQNRVKLEQCYSLCEAIYMYKSVDKFPN